MRIIYALGMWMIAQSAICESTPSSPGTLVRQDMTSARDATRAKAYNEFKDKGRIVNGRRATIMTQGLSFRVGDRVEVTHVLEVVVKGQAISRNGPKPIYDEYVDGRLASKPTPGAMSGDGIVRWSPGIDFNYAITEYVFDKPGAHTIRWIASASTAYGQKQLKSNIITLQISEGSEASNHLIDRPAAR